MPLFLNPPQEWCLGNDAILVGAANVTNVLVANKVYLLAVTVRGVTVISAMRTHIGATATGTTDLGIYDVNGNLLSHSGVVTNVANTTMTNNLLATQTLYGLYYLALTCSNSTDTYSRMTSIVTPGALGTPREATTTATAGVLPSTLGVILPPSGAFPVLGAPTQNGLP